MFSRCRNSSRPRAITAFSALETRSGIAFLLVSKIAALYRVFQFLSSGRGGGRLFMVHLRKKLIVCRSDGLSKVQEQPCRVPHCCTLYVCFYDPPLAHNMQVHSRVVGEARIRNLADSLVVIVIAPSYRN